MNKNDVLILLVSQDYLLQTGDADYVVRLNSLSGECVVFNGDASELITNHDTIYRVLHTFYDMKGELKV